VGGFGSGFFGDGPFGAFDWAKQVLFYDLPSVDRQADREDGGGTLENWADSQAGLFRDLLESAIGLETLRDPDDVRTQYQENISVRLTSAVVEEDGLTVRVEVEDTDPSDPFVPLGDTSVGWILTDSDGREFIVTDIHKLSDAFIIKGNILPNTGASPVGDATLRPPSIIEYLGNDYGVEIDQHDPESFQRAIVRNAWQLYAAKGAQRGYEIVGKMAGYDVVAVPLWRLCGDSFDPLAPNQIFEIPENSGNYYTNQPPTRPSFDDVSLDAVPLDMMCWDTPNWTTDAIEPPAGPLPDGTSVSDAINSYTQGLTISSTTDLGGGRWRIEVNGSADLWSIARHGRWYANFPSGDSGDFWLETTPVDGGASWTFEILAGTAPTFGATVNLSYDCPEQSLCCYCRASTIRVEITPDEILNEPTARLDGALERVRDRILKVVPIHVRVADLVHIVGPVELAVGVAGQHLIMTASQQRALFAYMPVGYYFDMVPADELTLDPAHLHIDGSQFEIGTGDSISGTAPNMTLTDAAGGFDAGMVGKDVVISGATTPANDGTFPITGYVSPTQITYTNAGGVAEVFAGSWTVEV